LGRSPSIAVTCLILPMYMVERTATGCGSSQGTLSHQRQRQHRLRTQNAGRAISLSSFQPFRRR
jgi:hypothetical protein